MIILLFKVERRKKFSLDLSGSLVAVSSCNEAWLCTSRVTRLGEFLPFVSLFTFMQFYENYTNSTNLLGTFSVVKVT
jgi:hypothetical protein